ncbi:hypothetical protein ACWEP8_02275 [Streptomyces hydrogenans]
MRTTFDDVVDFFNAYLDSDFEGNLAVASKSDNEVQSCKEVSSQFFYSGDGVAMSVGFGRPTGWPEEKIDELAQQAQVVRRPLLLVIEYCNAEWGPVFAGYIGGDRPRTAASYGALLYVAFVREELRIIATFREDFGAVSPPIHWIQSQGVQVAGLGDPVAVRALEPPVKRAVHLQDWERLRDSAS